MDHFPQCIASNGIFCIGRHVGDSDETANTLSNFEIWCDFTCSRLCASLRVSIKRTWFAMIPDTTHAFYGNSPQTRNDIMSNLKVGQSVKCKIEMSSFNYSIFHHYCLTWPQVQNIPLEATHCGKCFVSSLQLLYGCEIQSDQRRFITSSLVRCSCKEWQSLQKLVVYRKFDVPILILFVFVRNIQNKKWRNRCKTEAWGACPDFIGNNAAL